MCDCVICQACQGPCKKTFTEHIGASLTSKLQQFDEEGALDPELKVILLRHGESSLSKRLRSGAYKNQAML